LKNHVHPSGKKLTPGLHQDFTKKKFEHHHSGLFYNDAMNSQGTNPDDVSKVSPFIWLLNMMSHYRDLLVDKAVKDSLHEEDTGAKNFMETKFPFNEPLSFLADDTHNKKEWTMRGYSAGQTDYQKALTNANDRLCVPKKRVLQKMESTYLSGWATSHQLKAALEADLALVRSVVEMTWIPDKYMPVTQPSKKPQSSLLGYFEVKVKRHGGHFAYVKVATDWVEKNFKNSVLGVVQRVACEKLEVMEDSENLFTKTQKQGYLKVETKNITFSAKDKRVINRLKYKRGWDTTPHQ
jgi:hypothetical protein